MIGPKAVNGLHLEEGIKAFVILRRSNLARHLMTRPQVESLDLRRRDINIIWTGEVVVVLRPEKTVPFLHHFQHTGGEQFPLFFRTRLEDAHNQFLLLQAGIAGNFHLLRELGEILDFLSL